MQGDHTLFTTHSPRKGPYSAGSVSDLSRLAGALKPAVNEQAADPRMLITDESGYVSDHGWWVPLLFCCHGDTSLLMLLL